MKRVKILNIRNTGWLICAVAIAIGAASCDKDDAVNTNLIGKVFQGTTILSKRGEASPVYSQLIYRFIDNNRIESFQQEVKTVGSTTTHGIIGPDTLYYRQDGAHITLMPEELEDGTVTESIYDFYIKEQGIEMWLADGLQCILTPRKNVVLDGTKWMAYTSSLPTSIPKDITLEFAGGKLLISSLLAAVPPSPSPMDFRTVGNVMVGKFSMNDKEYSNFVALFHGSYSSAVASTQYIIYTNIEGTGTMFKPYEETVPTN